MRVRFPIVNEQNQKNKEKLVQGKKSSPSEAEAEAETANRRRSSKRTIDSVSSQTLFNLPNPYKPTNLKSQRNPERKSREREGGKGATFEEEN